LRALCPYGAINRLIFEVIAQVAAQAVAKMSAPGGWLKIKPISYAPEARTFSDRNKAAFRSASFAMTRCLSLFVIPAQSAISLMSRRQPVRK
jgi:hypothetical protein